jgi:hypothetical protein
MLWHQLTCHAMEPAAGCFVATIFHQLRPRSSTHCRRQAAAVVQQPGGKQKKILYFIFQHYTLFIEYKPENLFKDSFSFSLWLYNKNEHRDIHYKN